MSQALLAHAARGRHTADGAVTARADSIHPEVTEAMLPYIPGTANRKGSPA